MNSIFLCYSRVLQQWIINCSFGCKICARCENGQFFNWKFKEKVSFGCSSFTIIFLCLVEKKAKNLTPFSGIQFHIHTTSEWQVGTFFKMLFYFYGFLLNSIAKTTTENILNLKWTNQFNWVIVFDIFGEYYYWAYAFVWSQEKEVSFFSVWCVYKYWGWRHFFSSSS